MTYVLALYAIMSAVTFIAYGVDKRAAVRGRARTRERTLHTMELLGGFAGAFVARHVFRHKRRKFSYTLVLWMIIIAHAAAWAAWWRYGWA